MLCLLETWTINFVRAGQLNPSWILKSKNDLLQLIRTDNIHGVIVEYPEVSILTDDCEEMAAWGERELVDGALAHAPTVERVPCRLGFARVNRVAGFT